MRLAAGRAKETPPPIVVRCFGHPAVWDPAVGSQIERRFRFLMEKVKLKVVKCCPNEKL